MSTGLWLHHKHQKEPASTASTGVFCLTSSFEQKQSPHNVSLALPLHHAITTYFSRESPHAPHLQPLLIFSRGIHRVKSSNWHNPPGFRGRVNHTVLRESLENQSQGEFIRTWASIWHIHMAPDGFVSKLSTSNVDSFSSSSPFNLPFWGIRYTWHTWYTLIFRRSQID